MNFLKKIANDPKYFFYLSYFLIFCAVSFGFFSRVYSVFRYEHFWGDQSRDAFVYDQMRNGNWPNLGPGSSVGSYSLTPIYYYLNFIFSLGSGDPAWQAFPNALFSFLSIPLLIYFILLAVNGFKSARSWLVASFCGLWWSVFFNDIKLANVEWNPNSIPFFFLLFLIVSRYCLEFYESNRLKESFNTKLKLAIAWAFLGLIVGILIGLHSVTLFVTPIIFIGICVYFFWKTKSWFFLYGWLSLLLLHIGYIQGEIARSWQNTNNLIKLVTTPSEQTHTILQRINRSIFNYIELGDLSYFTHTYAGILASFFLTLVLGLGILKYNGNKTIWSILWASWLLYSYVVSNYWGIIFIHYKLIIIFAPILFTAFYLNYFDYKKIQESVLAVLVLALSVTSIISNSIISFNYLGVKYGDERLSTIDDLKLALSKVPNNSDLCLGNDYFDLKTSFDYIARKTIVPTKSFNIVKDCYDGQTAIHYKFKELEDLRLTPNKFTNKYTKIWFENEAVILYQI